MEPPMNSKFIAAITVRWPPISPLAATSASRSPVFVRASLRRSEYLRRSRNFRRSAVRLRQFHGLIGALVEQHGQPVGDRQPHVMVAVRADPEVLLQFAVEDHLFAVRALFPEVVGDLPAAADEFPAASA